MVSSTPGLTAKWLVPRLYKFLALHPDIETRITASVGYANFTTDDIDVGIRLSSGAHPDLYVEKLSDEWLLPLCSPRLLDGDEPLRAPQDLKRFTLIQVDLPGVVPTWTDWMRHGRHRGRRQRARAAAQRGRSRARRGERGRGRGAGLQDGRLARYRAEAAGGAVRAARFRCPGRSYYFVCAKGDEKRAPIKAFRDWVFAEIARDARGAARGARTGPAAGGRAGEGCTAPAARATRGH